MERREVFDATAELYDEVRPRYPEPLVEDVVRLSRIPEHGRILEIGCGTGQATLAFARRGYAMTCVEPGEHLAALAERNLAPYPGAIVRRGLFEDCPLHERSFDLAISATAIHHVRPAARYVKTAIFGRSSWSAAGPSIRRWSRSCSWLLCGGVDKMDQDAAVSRVRGYLRDRRMP